MKRIIDLYPEAPNEWLYRDHDDDLLPDGTPRRQFEPSVTIPFADLPLWHECTTAEKQAWEAEHLPVDPEPSPSPESSESEPVAGVVDPADPANEGKEAEE